MLFLSVGGALGSFVFAAGTHAGAALCPLFGFFAGVFLARVQEGPRRCSACKRQLDEVQKGSSRS